MTKPIVLYPTSVAHWHALLTEAQVASSRFLGEELESYLVFMLMRYTNSPEMANKVFAEDYLRAHLQQRDSCRKEILRGVGDQCLIYAGLFPERAERKRVSSEYFVDLGQGAYHSLSELELSSVAELFFALAKQFPMLTEVLLATREVSLHTPNKNCLLQLDTSKVNLVH